MFRITVIIISSINDKILYLEAYNYDQSDFSI